jgi:uncharacterized membrane protein YphA (DoxX/SURF4 family)
LKRKPRSRQNERAAAADQAAKRKFAEQLEAERVAFVRREISAAEKATSRVLLRLRQGDQHVGFQLVIEATRDALLLPVGVKGNRLSMTNFTSSEASSTRSRTIAYWVTTLILATECAVGGVMGALKLPAFIGIMERLGYPAYFMIILGVWYVLAGPALLVPRFARLKEWAYAGLVFTYTGAAASRLAVGDGAETLVAPIIFTGLTAASWALRPSDRRDLAPISAASSRSRTIAYWITTVLIALEWRLGACGTSCSYHTFERSWSTWTTRFTSWLSLASGRYRAR